MTRPARLLAAVLLAACAAIHLYLVPEHTDADHTAMGHAYIGWLFLVGGVLLLLLAMRIAVRGDGWNLAATLCAGMVLALLASRTIGLPNGYQEAWEPLAVWSLATELGFLVLFILWVVRRQPVAPAGAREGG